ncbi:MAG: class I SAM-dependent methyltransferase [Bacteroidetes bacterium]|nr:class I SAM-dependent methyltransferase [Bacteroidota bacterium]
MTNRQMDNERIYEHCDWENLTRDALSEKIIHIFNLIPDDVNSIIDVGCGNGVITNELSRKFEIVGVDRSEKALSYVKTAKLLSDSNAIPLPDQSFDMVFSSELLEHLEEESLKKTITELKRLTRKYLLVTVPNAENPDKLMIQCPACHFIFNRPNHLRSFRLSDFKSLFGEFEILKHELFGKRVRYYNPKLLEWKRRFSPSHAWIPSYWIPAEQREALCPRCEHIFSYPYRFHLLSFLFDVFNVLISPKKPYWLFVLMEKKDLDV